GKENTLYFQIPKDEELWDGPFSKGTWALKGHYWICGKQAYKRLIENWKGICFVGYVKLLFFLLNHIQGSSLGIKVYNDLKREKQELHTFLTAEIKQRWKENEWTPQRIIEHYGPDTWNPHKLIHGARKSIHNLNCIIRLQVTLETTANQTANALDLLTGQVTQMRTSIFPYQIVLDCLFTEEGGVCGKLNTSNCCLQINVNGKAVEQIEKEIQKLAHVPFQTSKGWDIDMFSWLPVRSEIKKILFFVV
ncbi:ENR1 protein, partial [Tyrannus savana]|nr:ENR1 protein [Tyrannus savana]